MEKLHYKIITGFEHSSFKFIDEVDSKIALKDILCDYSTEQTDKEGNIDFYICLLPMEHLGLNSFFNDLTDSEYRKRNRSKHYSPKPIIFITAYNIFKDFHIETRLTQEATFNENEKKHKERVKHFNLDKRKGYLDNSIWHFYVPIQNNEGYVKNGKVLNFEQRLKRAVQVIKRNIKYQLYDTLVAKENLEFQMRLMLNSYIDNIGGDHSQHLTPFVFHSEGEAFFKTNQKINTITQKLKSKSKDLKKIEWRVLLIDDYADKGLKLHDGKVGKKKKEILETILDQIKEQSDNKFIFHIETVAKKEGESTILDALNGVFKENKYDIILLDYLLDDDEKKERTFGSELFTNPKYKNILKENSRGLLGKFWILPISSFNKAMLDKISNEGIERVSKDWYLFDGADVISTPELFKYSLVNLMDLQLRQALVPKNEIVNYVFNNNDWESKSIYEENNNITVRQIARMKYGEYMHKFGLREHLKIDEKKSKFAETVLKVIDKEYSEDTLLYENTRKLIYLLGFGTRQQLPEMWETFTRVKQIVNSKDQIVVNSLIKISKYINSL